MDVESVKDFILRVLKEHKINLEDGASIVIEPSKEKGSYHIMTDDNVYVCAFTNLRLDDYADIPSFMLFQGDLISYKVDQFLRELDFYPDVDGFTLGVWKDNDGVIWCDVGVMFLDEQIALKCGEYFQQQAIWNNTNKSTIDCDKNKKNKNDAARLIMENAIFLFRQ